MRFLKHLSLYTFVGFFGAGINFFLLPYLSHFITPAQYGILSLINTYVTILIPLVSLVASGIISVEYYQMADRSEFKKFFSSVQMVPIVPTLFFLVISLLFSTEIARLMEIPVDKAYWIPLSVLIAFFVIYFETLLTLTIAQQRPISFAIFNISKLVLEVILTIILVTKTKLGWEGRLVSWFVVSVLITVIAFLYFKGHQLLTWQVSWKYMKRAVFFGLPLILHTIGKFVINQSDRLFIAKMVSLDEAGIYNIGYQVGMILMFFVTAAANYMAPFLNERLVDITEKKKHQIVDLTFTIIGIFVILLLGISIGSSYFFKWFVDPRYTEGSRFVFWVALGYLFFGIYILFAGYLYFGKKTAFLGYMAVLNVVVNLFFNFILIPKFGAMGAAYATCISFFIFAVIIAWKANSLYKMPWLYFLKRSKNVY